MPQSVNTDEGPPGSATPEPTKKTRKKTVTFKNVLETSDDITVKKVYNPSGTPLVPIIKKDSSIRSMESIVKPSRLTEIVKQSSFNNLNRIKTLGFDVADDRDEEEEEEQDPREGVKSVSDCGNGSSTPPIGKDPLEVDAEEEADVDNEREAGNVAVGDKRFILPKRSLHSRRVIKPNKKFLDDMDGCSAKALKRVNSGNKVKAVTVVKTEVAESNVIVPAPTVKTIVKAEAKDGAVGEVLLKKEKDLATKEVASLFGQPVSSVGTDLNLTPFGSNKVILRQPRLQFAMPVSTPAAPTNNLFGFTSNSAGATEHTIIGSGSTLSQSVVAAPLKTNALVASGEYSLGLSSCSVSNALILSLPGSPMVCAICSSKISFNFFEKSSRKFGVNSCELCRKFISKMIKRHGMVTDSASSTTYSPLQCSKSEGE